MVEKLGSSVPARVEKQAERVALTLGKLAAESIKVAASFTGVKAPPMAKALKPPAQPLGKSTSLGDGGAKASPSPGDYKPSFLDNSGAAAQRGSDDKLHAGNSTTMPG